MFRRCTVQRLWGFRGCTVALGFVVALVFRSFGSIWFLHSVNVQECQLAGVCRFIVDPRSMLPESPCQVWRKARGPCLLCQHSIARSLSAAIASFARCDGEQNYASLGRSQRGVVLSSVRSVAGPCKVRGVSVWVSLGVGVFRRPGFRTWRRSESIICPSIDRPACPPSRCVPQHMCRTSDI